MKFENTPGGSGESYEKPKAGKYLGVLTGFAYLGTQPGGQYGPKPKVMLHWTLFKRKGPSVDTKGYQHTITQRFGATVRGENSMLRKALEAHGIDVAEGQATSSQEWLGKTAWLDLEEVKGDNGKEYTNVAAISRLDPEDDEPPVCDVAHEHWDDADAAAGVQCPDWAAWAVAKSTDLSDLAPTHAGGGGKGKPRPRTSGSASPAPALVGAGANTDGRGEPIPF